MQKKQFPCGHKDKVKYCHLCKRRQQDIEKSIKIKAEKKHWEQTFRDDLVDLQALGRKNLILKARRIISLISLGTPYTDFKGKRLNYNRKVISVPINHDFRLIYKQYDSELILSKIMSHEEYNIRKPG